MTWNEARSLAAAEAIGSGILDEVKAFLRVDGDEDDLMIYQCAMASMEYIEDAAGEFDETSYKAKLLLYAITQDLYDHRELTQSEQQQKLRQSYTYQTILLQLKLAYDLKQEEGENESS